MLKRYYLPRPLHPFAWWGYALGLAVAASLTLNPLLLASIIAIAVVVVLERRGDNPWAHGFKLYLWLGAFVVVFRIAFRILFGGGDGPTILLDLPQIPLPDWVVGIRLLGPISLESLLTGLYDGLRLATIIICVGAANSLANPKRVLAAFPAALYELGTILVVTVSVFPQLGESVHRVMRVRKLRQSQASPNRRQRLGVIQSIIVPVLSDALDRSLSLAASMEARGYGRSGKATPRERNIATLLSFFGVFTLGVWAYFLLAAPPLGTVFGKIDVAALATWGLLFAGVSFIMTALRSAGRHVQRTRYRRDRWGLAETITVMSGVALALATVWSRSQDPGLLAPSIWPFQLPQLSLMLMLALAAALLPAFLTPRPALVPSRIPKDAPA